MCTKRRKIVPVVIDESLTGIDAFLLALKMGYSGAALKACKGQSMSLLIAALAQKRKVFLCVQDLTCPGASLVHSVTLAAHVPGVKAIEANARQYVPAANAGWEKRFPGIFIIRDGQVRTDWNRRTGFGSHTFMSVSRRMFLGAAASALAAQPQAQAFKPQLVLFSKHLPNLNYEDLAKTAKELGFDGVDLTVRPKGHVLPERVAEDLPRAVDTLRKHGLTVPMITTETHVGYGPGCDSHPTHSGLRSASHSSSPDIGRYGAGPVDAQREIDWRGSASPCYACRRA